MRKNKLFRIVGFSAKAINRNLRKYFANYRLQKTIVSNENALMIFLMIMVYTILLRALSCFKV